MSEIWENNTNACKNYVVNMSHGKFGNIGKLSLYGRWQKMGVETWGFLCPHCNEMLYVKVSSDVGIKGYKEKEDSE